MLFWFKNNKNKLKHCATSIVYEKKKRDALINYILDYIAPISIRIIWKDIAYHSDITEKGLKRNFYRYHKDVGNFYFIC